MEVNVFNQDENLTFMILVMENTLIHSFRQIFDSSWKKNKNQQKKNKTTILCDTKKQSNMFEISVCILHL